MSTILLIAALTIVFIVGMTFFTNEVEFRNAERWASLSATVQKSNDGGSLGGDDYTIQINFTGAIAKKTKITITSGTYFTDAISLSGGLTADADARAIMMDATITQAGTYYIAKVTSKEKICINSGDIDDLVDLPGVGTVTAQRIIDKRSELGGFSYLEQLKTISGIGDVTFDNLKDSIILWE